MELESSSKDHFQFHQHLQKLGGSGGFNSESHFLLVTKADLNSKIENLKEIVLSLRNTIANLSQKQIERYQKIIDAVIQSDRLFFIEKPKNAYDNRFDDKILQQVYDRSEFWERQINGNTVDMSNINFSVSKEILAKLRD